MPGPDGYVSPDWYGIGDQVPTWNYVAVHLRGTLDLLPQESLRGHLDRLSAAFEGRLLPKPPWKTDKLSADVLERFLRMIVPCRMTIGDVQGTWKLGQNKTAGARLRRCRRVGRQSGRAGACGPGGADAGCQDIAQGTGSAMRLYHSPTTPFGRKVMVALLETGQAGDVTVIEAAGTPLAPGTLPVGHNPLGKIPALELDDGTAIYDSRVICRYLDARSGGRLYPPEPHLWRTLTLEATADGILDAAVLMVYEVRVRPEESRFAPWVEAQWAKIARALDSAEARWMQHLAGPLDMGQIALGSALGYLDFRLGARNWRDGRPGLAAWEGQFARRDSMAATVPRG